MSHDEGTYSTFSFNDDILLANLWWFLNLWFSVFAANGADSLTFLYPFLGHFSPILNKIGDVVVTSFLVPVPLWPEWIRMNFVFYSNSVFSHSKRIAYFLCYTKFCHIVKWNGLRRHHSTCSKKLPFPDSQFDRLVVNTIGYSGNMI